MGLYWRRARVGVRFEDRQREDERDYPADAIVIAAGPERAADPAFARDVRRIVMMRTLEHEMEDGPEAGDGDDGAMRAAERAFLERFLDEGDGEDGQGIPEREPAWDELADALAGSVGGLGWYAREVGCPGGPAVQLIVNRCDEVIVGG
ncbi:hypothetical protein E0L17_02715 [Olsenella sp. SW781]|uniref:hypothetical protein n=1 Tax=Olsenella sp. SW781 TaxID=2530046 RepID=UPI00143B76E9|nr:hypothetical protein [Olsenella sp. SW781]NJE80234.1 hypothetical protein [Olsenella sp. SW781]